jgi:hypothetical protein
VQHDVSGNLVFARDAAPPLAQIVGQQGIVATRGWNLRSN